MQEFPKQHILANPQSSSSARVRSILSMSILVQFEHKKTLINSFKANRTLNSNNLNYRQRMTKI